MSLQTLRHTFLNEILTWAVFLILSGTLIAVGVNVHLIMMQWVLAVVWVVLLVVIYRWKYRRL